MFRITMAHTIRKGIKSESLHTRFGFYFANRYYHN